MKNVPKNYQAHMTPECSESMAAPVLDIGGATVSSLVALGSLASAAFCDFTILGSGPPSDEVKRCQRASLTAAVGGLVATVGYLAGAATGFSRRRHCVAARRAHKTWLRMGSPPPPLPLPRPPHAPPGMAPPGLVKTQPPECVAWKRRLADARSVAEKLALVKQRPATCR